MHVRNKMIFLAILVNNFRKKSHWQEFRKKSHDGFFVAGGVLIHNNREFEEKNDGHFEFRPSYDL